MIGSISYTGKIIYRPAHQGNLPSGKEDSFKPFQGHICIGHIDIWRRINDHDGRPNGIQCRSRIGRNRRYRPMRSDKGITETDPTSNVLNFNVITHLLSEINEDKLTPTPTQHKNVHRFTSNLCSNNRKKNSIILSELSKKRISLQKSVYN